MSNAPKLPPLTMLRAFEAVGRTGGMRKAAADIGVSHTVVGRHVHNLEHWMGQKLVETTPRGVVLTASGQVLFGAVERAFRIIGNSAAELRPAHPRTALRIWCMPGLATRWMTPRLAVMEAALGPVDISLRAIDRLPDFSSGEADLMIGFGSADAIPENSRKLIQPRMFPVASPIWIAQHGAPDDLAALARAPLIHEESKQQWTDWFDAMRHRLTDELKGPRLWDANLGFDAALAGQGIALVTRLTAGSEIDEGRLVEILESQVRLGGYYLMIAPQRRGKRILAQFEAWLADNLAED
ncbi:LysR substrate-binding domain-containing protein [Devosia sp. RR2S18]|uniref:LysR substrate-binding domain-containing protein n=1 Tax=Devosia rhizosphaerae TaxID=3049774 RepID=UPI00253FF3FB|nr:LysR substrate-binding domain-containing protein [Devosia sp. RR2S18]WIJ25094.1 LysR substrate-binding domain-containing protein [Devosia sp. RR2S18]